MNSTRNTQGFPTSIEGEFLHYRHQLDQYHVWATLLNLMLACLAALASLKGSMALAGSVLAVALLGSLLLLLLRVRLETPGWEND